MNIAVIFAGGSGTRMRSKDLPKQFLEVHGKSIIIYTIEHFENHHDIDAIMVVCIKDYIDYLKKLVDRAGLKKVRWILPGGDTPLHSQYIGLTALTADISKNERHIVLLHDGVRPLINAELITNCIESVKIYGTAITISPAVETIITVNEHDNVDRTIKRRDCRLGRAPQCFYLDEIIAIHNRALEEKIRDIPDLFIDSATMMQHYGYPIHVVEGPVENIKITTHMDFFVFKALLDVKENLQISV